MRMRKSNSNNGAAGHPPRGLAVACDVWSATVTLYFMLTARWPFSRDQVTSWGDIKEKDWKHDADAMSSALPASIPAE